MIVGDQNCLIMDSLTIVDSKIAQHIDLTAVILHRCLNPIQLNFDESVVIHHAVKEWPGASFQQYQLAAPCAEFHEWGLQSRLQFVQFDRQYG